jgi:uncharacterized protein (DUF169 family)
MDLNTEGKKLQDLLGLALPPVAISFRDTAPDGVPHVRVSGPSGCSYWKLAAEGETFYTDAADHLNCTIGAYTHNVEMPPEKAKELESMIGEMVNLQYIRSDEVPSIPRRDAPFSFAVYAPLTDARFDPDVVIVRGSAQQTMVLIEAAKAADIGHNTVAMGRPTCAMIPAAIQSDSGVSSFGCVGNRVYTGLGEDELYFAIPGSKITQFVEKLDAVCNANEQLETLHRQHAAAVAGAAN